MWLRPSCQGRGLGRRLMDACLDEARRLDSARCAWTPRPARGRRPPLPRVRFQRGRALQRQPRAPTSGWSGHSEFLAAAPRGRDPCARACGALRRPGLGRPRSRRPSDRARAPAGASAPTSSTCRRPRGRDARSPSCSTSTVAAAPPSISTTTRASTARRSRRASSRLSRWGRPHAGPPARPGMPAPAAATRSRTGRRCRLHPGAPRRSRSAPGVDRRASTRRGCPTAP